MRNLHSRPVSLQDSALLIIDIQQKLAPRINGIDEILSRNKALIMTGMVLKVPVLFTEQYPAGLGKTDPGLLEEAPNAMVHEKINFNAAAETPFLEHLSTLKRNEIIMTGTEAHVCVLQTALGLAQKGYSVRLCADAIGSRNPNDLTVAIDRARLANISIVTTEMVIFEWLKRANTDEFRSLLPIIRELSN